MPDKIRRSNKKMSEIIHENYLQGRKEYLEELKRIKRKKRIESILSVFVGLFIVFATIVILLGLSNNNSNNLESECDNAKGHTCSYYELRQFSLGK